MYCPNCHAEGLDDELYCRFCGAELIEHSTSLVPSRSYIPAVFQNSQVSRVAAGVGALAVGVGIELLRRSLLARFAQPSAPVANALPTLNGLKEILMPLETKTKTMKAEKLPKGYEIEETVVYMRRVIRRER
ncbi:MAG TPA: zinc ribbon domain-containing protein [Ktedonobacteraceae bacterium]|nr:zinc ribbon domain-containing protein [Ktedonobacteraceae bacterium]